MIHLTVETKGQTFLLRDGWHLIFRGVVPRVTWNSRAAVEAQLGLLRSGYSALTDDGRIIHRSGIARRCAGEGR